MNFSDALDTTVGEIERPPLPPLGTYRFLVSKHPEINQDNPDYDIVNFQMKGVAAMDDVDEDELKEYGQVGGISVRLSFLFDKNDTAKFKQTEYRLRTFLVDHLQIEGAEAVSLKEALAGSVNCQCLGVLSYRADKRDPEVQYAEIRKTAPVE